MSERSGFIFYSVCTLLFHLYCTLVTQWFLEDMEEEPKYLLKNPTSVSGAFYTKSLASKSLRESMDREDTEDAERKQRKAMAEEFGGMPPSMVGAPVGLAGGTMPLGSAPMMRMPGAAPASTGPFQPAPMGLPSYGMGPPGSMMGPPPSTMGPSMPPPGSVMGPPPSTMGPSMPP